MKNRVDTNRIARAIRPGGVLLLRTPLNTLTPVGLSVGAKRLSRSPGPFDSASLRSGRTANLRDGLIAVLLVLLSGCAAFKAEPRLDPDSAACYRFLEKMDRLVTLAGAGDAGAARIEGFPHLRISRFLASFTADSLQDEAYRFWLDALRRADTKARQIELHNLPSRQRLELQADAPGAAPAERAVAACGAKLAASDLTSPVRRSLLLERAKAPDSYLGWQRAVGFYPATRLVFAQAVERLHRELRQTFALPVGKLPVVGELVRYQPPLGSSLHSKEVARILADSTRNPFAVPQPFPQDLERLFQNFAPIFEVDTRDENDRIGTIRLQNSREARVDAATPVVYRLPSHTRFHDRTLLQLNYLVWFGARPPASAVDIYAGRFDGLIWRVTLPPDGNPLAYDSIHPCGCYYQVFPAAGFGVVQPRDGSEPIFSPQIIDPPQAGARLVIRLAHGTHFIQKIYADQASDRSVVYGWRDYDELLSLQAPDGERRSLFDPEGFVPGSGRPERFLFWPMGVPSAGAMRQTGTHAIAFLGRRHFDDARLLETFLRPLDSRPTE